MKFLAMLWPAFCKRSVDTGPTAPAAEPARLLQLGPCAPLVDASKTG